MNDQNQCAHPHFEVKCTCAECGKQLGNYELARTELSPAELQEQHAAALPGREAMSLVNANLAIPINVAAALNVLSDGSIAGAAAQQTTPIGQTAVPTAPGT